MADQDRITLESPVPITGNAEEPDPLVVILAELVKIILEEEAREQQAA